MVLSFFLIGILIILTNKMLAEKNSLHRVVVPTNSIGAIFYYSVASFLFFLVFLSLKNEFINQDGLAFTRKFMDNVPTIGVFVTHDEMLEFYLHSRFWYYTNLLFGWSVTYSYQFLSAFAGGVFVFILLVFSAEVMPKQFLESFFLMISGGFMQLFFGDVENYSLVSVVILLYFLLAYLFVKGKVKIIAPSMMLSLAMCFHLLAGWLLPSLVYLWIISARRKEYSQLMIGLASYVLVFLLTLLFLHFHGLPIRSLYYRSHAFGHGGHILEMLTRPSLEYYWQLINLLFLMFPALLMFIPLLTFKRIDASPFNVFMILSTLFMLAFMFTWNAMLGVYNDWNLFAPCAIPLSILWWYNFVRISNLKYKTGICLGIFSTSMLHSYSWIISNHFL